MAIYDNTYFGLSRTIYQLEPNPFSSGGEGDIYRIVGNDKYVAKIYHSGVITKDLEEKIRLMTQKPPKANILNQVAWPIDALYDQNYHFCGFLMPKLDISTELSSIYVYPPTKGKSQLAYHYKIVIAQNICTVISAVHAAGYIFGDFNPHNIGINLTTGHVAFLDTDSYHIVLDEKSNKAYRCNVCLDGYVAPELLKRCEPYKKDAYALAPLPTFTEATDNFALAIHIFRLLMNGFTPFNGIKETDSISSASPGIGNQAIKRDSYCFKPGNKPQSVAVPPIDILPEEIQQLFTRAFIDGRVAPEARPSAQEWYIALENYCNSLVRCSKDQNHLFKKTLLSCPWCEADNRYKSQLAAVLSSGGQQKSFPSASNQKPAGGYVTGGSAPHLNIWAQNLAQQTVTNQMNPGKNQPKTPTTPTYTPKQAISYTNSHLSNNKLAQIRQSINNQHIDLFGLSDGDISSTTAIALTNVNSSVRFCVFSSHSGYQYKEGKKIPSYTINVDSVLDMRMSGNQLILKQKKKWLTLSLDGKKLSSTKAPLFGPDIIKNRAMKYAFINEFVNLRDDGTLTASPVHGKQVTLSRRGENKKYTDFAMCNEHFIALLDDGTVQSWFFLDNQDYGQCDVGTWRNIKKVCVCQHLSVGLTKDGNVVFAGKKGFEELSNWNNVIDIASSLVYVIGLTEDGKVLGTNGFTNVLSSWENIIKIAISDNHIVAGLRSDGNVLVYLSGSTFEIPLGTDIQFYNKGS